MKEDDNAQRPSDAVIALADFIDAVYGPAFEGREHFQELHTAVMREVYPHMRRDLPPPLRYFPTCSACKGDRTSPDCEPCEGTGLNLQHPDCAPIVLALRSVYVHALWNKGEVTNETLQREAVELWPNPALDK